MARVARESFSRWRFAHAACALTGAVCVGWLSALDSAAVYGTVSALLWVVVVVALLHRGAPRNDGVSLTAIQLGLGFRLVMAFLYIGIVAWFYGGNADYLGYQDGGAAFAEGLLRGELVFWDKLPKGLIVLFGLLCVLVGPWIPSMFALSALLGFIGAYLTLRACQLALPAGRADLTFLGIMLFALPSFVMWTSVLGKESLMLFFVGLTAYAFANVLAESRPIHYVALLAGVAGATATRAAVGAILALSLVVALAFWRPRTIRVALLRPAAVTLGMAIGVVLFWWLTLFAIEEKYGQLGRGFADEGDVAGVLQYYHSGLTSDSPTPGSTLGLQVVEPTAFAILSYLPKGIFALFFRPFVFEAWNVLSLAAALESTALLVILVWRVRGVLASARLAVSEPFLAFCWIAVLFLAGVLSLGSNFGVMIRQRGMVLPFLFILLSIVPQQVLRGTTAPSTPRAP